MNELIETNELPLVPELAKIEGVEERTAVIDGVRWRYLHAGSGPPLLLVHGVTAYSFSWRYVIQGLARHYSVYAVDLPGCGFSQRCETLPGTLASDAEHLLSFMDHVGIEECDVLGTSRGGGAAIVMAGLAAERAQLHRIRKLVLSAPINPWSRIGALRIRFFRTRAGRFYLVHLEPRTPVVVKSFFQRLFGSKTSIPADSLVGYQAGWAPAGSLQHLWKIARSWTADLKQIESLLPLVRSVPALILWGEHDKAVDPMSAQQLHRRCHNSVVRIMNGVGHMPYEEAPEEFNREVLDFLLSDTVAAPVRRQVQPAREFATTVPIRA
jgi:pimeloyl-ACP methyl ester carboxylesterase